MIECNDESLSKEIRVSLGYCLKSQHNIMMYQYQLTKLCGSWSNHSCRVHSSLESILDEHF